MKHPTHLAEAPVLSFDPNHALDGEVGIELPTLIVTRLLITGDSRSGKSRMIRQLLEQTYGQVPHLVIDPEGDFATLRERFDYLLVGRGGELAADVATAAQLARSLFQLQANAILDLSDLKSSAQREYVAAFATALMEIHQHEGHSTLIVVDEAQFFGPEGGKAISHDPLMEISHRGGKRGLCMVAVTPTLSELSKEIARGLQNRLIFRTTLDNDIERASKRLGFRTREQKEQLEHLVQGECFAYGPALSERRVVRVRGVEKTLTTHIDITKGARPPVMPARESLNALVAQLREFEQKDKAERQTTDELHRQVKNLEAVATDLQAKLETARTAPRGISPEQHEADVRAAAGAAVQQERERQDRLRQVLQGGVRQAHECLRSALAHLESVDETVDHRWLSAPTFEDSTDNLVKRIAATTDVRLDETSDPLLTPPDPAAGARTSVPHRILGAIKFCEERGVPATRAQIAALVGMSPKTGAWAKRLSEVRAPGYVVDAGDRLELTADGRAFATVHRFAAAVPQSREDLQALWIAKLGADSKPGRMLRVLLSFYPDGITRAALAQHVGMKHDTGAFAKRLSELRSPGLLVDRTRTEVCASDVLFLAPGMPGLR